LIQAKKERERRERKGTYFCTGIERNIKREISRSTKKIGIKILTKD